MMPNGLNPLRRLLLLVAALAVSFPITIGIAAQTPAARAELLPLPTPDLSQIKPAFRKRVVSVLERVEALIADPAATDIELAEGYGTLGQYFQALNLFDAADPLFANAASLAPTDPLWPYLRGYVLIFRNRLEESATLFEKTVQLDPNDYCAWNRLARIRYDHGDLSGAKEAFEKGRAIDPQEAMSYFGLGEIAMAQGEVQAAIGFFQKTLELQPKADSVHYPLGLAYRRAGNQEKARYHIELRGEERVNLPDPRLAAISQLVTLASLDVVFDMAADTKSFSPRDFLGYINANLRDRPGLIEYFTAAIAEKATEPAPDKLLMARVQYAIANLYARAMAPDEAVDAYRKAIELAPNFFEPYLEASQILMDRSSFGPAAGIMDRLLSRSPRNGDALYTRAFARQQMGNPDAALADLAKLVEIEPTRKDCRFLFAKLLESREDWQGTVEQLKALAELDLSQQEQFFVHAKLGQYLQATGDVAGSIEHLHAVLALDPSQTGLRLNLAGALAFLDRYPEALEAYDRVLRDDPSNEPARLGQIAAAIMSDRLGQAKTLLEKGIRDLPQSQELANLLARLLAASPQKGYRDGARAVALARDLFHKQRSVTHAETLAMALAQAGNFAEAIELQRAIIASAEEAGDTQWLAILRANLKRYETNIACCQDPSPAQLLPIVRM